MISLIEDRTGIEKLRKEIDATDTKIIDLLKKRKDLTKEIGEIKRQSGKPIIDEAREHALIEKLIKISKEKGLDEDFGSSVYKIIIENSREEQKNI